MNCSHIRPRLTDPVAFHAPDVQRHIAQCDSCRARWEAEAQLRAAYAAALSSDLSTESAGTASQWVARAITHERKDVMNSPVRHPLATPGRRWGVAVAIAVLALLVVVPFPYDHTVGTRLSIAAPESPLESLDLAAIQQRLAERGLDKVSATTGDGGTITFFARGDADLARAAFDATRDLISAPAGNVTLAPWVVRESGSLLAQIGARVFEFEVATEGKSPEQIAAEIRADLEAEGLSMKNVTVGQDGDSTTITLEGIDGAPGDGQKEVIVRTVRAGDDLGSEPIEGKIVMPELDPSLSVEEQIAEIKRQLAAEGITDVEVTIENGQVKVTASKEIRK